jgi:hypothetical protein
MDKMQAVYFHILNNCKLWLYTFMKSIETEVGSAGEHPARDVIDVRRKCQFNGLSL